MRPRPVFDLHTLGGIVRTGVLIGFAAGLAVVASVLVRQLRGAGPAPTGAPLLFPVADVDPKAIGEGFFALRGARRHEAVDIAAPRGTAIRAAAAGRVRLTSRAGSGRTVEQDEASGRFCLIYAHLDGYALGLRDGDTVARGQTLGFVGTTGNAPPGAPHLHFAVHSQAGGGCWRGPAVDPVPLLAP